MNTQIDRGHSIEITATAAMLSGQPFLVGSLVGISANSYNTGDTAVIWLVGTHLVPKAAEAWAAGAKLYWDSANLVFTTTAGANTPAGYVAAAALLTDTMGQIILRQ